MDNNIWVLDGAIDLCGDVYHSCIHSYESCIILTRASCVSTPCEDRWLAVRFPLEQGTWPGNAVFSAHGPGTNMALDFRFSECLFVQAWKGASIAVNHIH